ncbi:MAG TPA: amidohydrolase family protein [Thermoplasmata archaeon]|nr:amidohydrolase family protein [Thermoplasmata archaeon]
MTRASDAVTEPPPRVDAHVHLSQWWPEIRRTGYRPDLDYTTDGLLQEMDRYSIDFALAIQLFQAPSEEAALEEGRGTFASSNGRLFPVATVDPTRGEASVAAAVGRMEAEPHLVGVKLFPGYLPFYPHDPRLGPVFEMAHRRRLPVLVHQGDTLDGRGLLKYARPLEVDEVAGRYRDVAFVLCHLGNPWIDEAAELVYKNPNVYADTSGLFPPPSARYFERAVERSRERILDAVVTSGAPERFLHGSDWPLEEIGLAAQQIERLALPPSDRAAILGGNAQRLFRLPPRRARP